jgi:hypothetical protein
MILFLLKEHRYLKSKNFKRTVLDILMISTLMCSVAVSFLLHYVELTLFPRLILNSIILFFFVLLFLNQTSNHKDKKMFSPKHVDIKNFRRETKSYLYTIENYDHKLKYKKKLKAYLYSLSMVVFAVVIDFAAILYSQYVFHIDINKINSNILNNTIIGSPGIIILCFMVYLSYIYVNTANVTIFKIWKSNKKFRILTYIQAFITTASSILIYKFIMKDNIIYSLNNDFIFKISIGVYILLILHVVIPWCLTLKKELAKYKLLHSQELN